MWGFFYENTVSLEFPKFTALLKKFFSEMSPWSYVGLLAYLPINDEVEELFRDIRNLIREKKGCSTIFGFGPRYLHSTGQLFKGGPILGRFIIFTRRGRKEEQVIPGEGYTFWDYMRGAWQKNNGMRIDHFLVSNSLIDQIKSININKDPRGREKPSDHTPIEIKLA